jgi:hypothetical protein
MKQKIYADIANRWNVMVENARPIVETLGPGAERHQSLATQTQTLMRLNEEAEAHRSELSRVVRLRKELVVAGGKTFSRFASDLQAHHGLDSSELIRYGMQPRGGRRKKKDPATAKPKAEAGKAQVEVAPA